LRSHNGKIFDRIIFEAANETSENKFPLKTKLKAWELLNIICVKCCLPGPTTGRRPLVTLAHPFLFQAQLPTS